MAMSDSSTSENGAARQVDEDAMPLQATDIFCEVKGEGCGASGASARTSAPETPELRQLQSLGATLSKLGSKVSCWSELLIVKVDGMKAERAQLSAELDRWQRLSKNGLLQKSCMPSLTQVKDDDFRDVPAEKHMQLQRQKPGLPPGPSKQRSSTDAAAAYAPGNALAIATPESAKSMSGDVGPLGKLTLSEKAPATRRSDVSCTDSEPFSLGQRGSSLLDTDKRASYPCSRTSSDVGSICVDMVGGSLKLQEPNKNADRGSASTCEFSEDLASLSPELQSQMRQAQSRQSALKGTRKLKEPHSTSFGVNSLSSIETRSAESSVNSEAYCKDAEKRQFQSALPQIASEGSQHLKVFEVSKKWLDIEIEDGSLHAHCMSAGKSSSIAARKIHSHISRTNSGFAHSQLFGGSFVASASYVSNALLDAETSECLGFPIVMHPTSLPRLVWECIAMLLIVYDILMIPMQVFPIPRSLFISFMGWLALGYWTADIPASFFVGFYRCKDGTLVRTLPDIAVRYASTWLLCDLVIVGLDVMSTAMIIASEKDDADASKTSAASMSLVRVAKVLRSLRVIRLVRVAKLNRSNFILMAQDALQSERLHILSHLFKHLITVMVVNHFTACLWYGFGSFEIDGYGNWVSVYLSTQTSWIWHYLTSLHWSLAQFANGEVLVEPKNIPERLVSITVLLLSMMIFSSFLAIVGNTVHKMLQAGSHSREDIWMLRMFLRQHTISLDLKVRVNRYISVMLQERQKKIHPSSVTLIQALSKPLQAELQTEMWTPLLVSHPLIWMIATWHKSLMRQVCAHTIKQFDLSSGDVLFCFGEEVEHLYFVSQGILKYTRQREFGGDPPYSLEAGMWICEAALWAERWMTLGSSHADVETELVGIDGDSFRQMAIKYSGITIQVMRDYGIAFVRNMNKAVADDTLSDMQMNILDDGPFGILIDFGNVAAEHEDLNGEEANEFRRRFRQIAQKRVSKKWTHTKTANSSATSITDACHQATRLCQSVYSNSDESGLSGNQERRFSIRRMSRLGREALGFGARASNTSRGSRTSVTSSSFLTSFSFGNRLSNMSRASRASRGSRTSRSSRGIKSTPTASFPLTPGSDNKNHSVRRSEGRSTS